MDPHPAWPAGPAELVKPLIRWARDTTWVEWLELGGSLGRGAGDAQSDVDAAVGVTGDGGIDAVQDAVTGFACAAAVLRQAFGSESTHLLTVYADGRQLSLVVMPSTARAGLPPQSVALVDKTGALATPLDPSIWDPDTMTRREWTFLACIAVSDAIKHSRRGKTWRALRSLNEARDLYLQLLAARERVIFPQFGAVSLENSRRSVPPGLASTLVGTLDPEAIIAAVGPLVALLQPFITEHELDDLVLALSLKA